MSTGQQHRHSWGRPQRSALVPQLPLVLALVALWSLLWDDLSWGTVLTGTVLALLVTRVLHLPAVELAGRFNVVWALIFVGHFVVDIVRSSLQVLAIAIRPRCQPQNAVIAVDLHTSSDLLMTVTAQALSLLPGSIIIEVDRRHTTLYIHVLDASTDEVLERTRRNVLAIEERLIRAIGSPEECRALDAERLAVGRRPRGRFG